MNGIFSDGISLIVVFPKLIVGVLNHLKTKPYKGTSDKRREKIF